MSWLKIDDQIATHHKIVGAGPAASWLWICSIAYAQNHLTDGFISDGVLGHLGLPKHSAKQLSSRLLKHGLWERVKGGFQVHDYLQHNASAAERKQELEAKSIAGRKGGRRSGQVRRHQRDTYTKQTDGDSFKQTGSTSRSRGQAPREAHSTPLHSDVQAGAPTARPADRTNTGGNGADQPRRDAPDAAGGGASAPVVHPLVQEARDQAEEIRRRREQR